jgi:hypothetical protein
MKGMKFDAGKPALMPALEEFSTAVAMVSKVVEFGAIKYERGSWRFVVDGQKRYREALLRHAIAGGTDDESKLLHAAHTAWNALAVLEFELARVVVDPEPRRDTKLDFD